jgi:hypothetical protein
MAKLLSINLCTHLIAKRNTHEPSTGQSSPVVEWLRHNILAFLEFSLCLSRACLGKIIIFKYKWLKKPDRRLTWVFWLLYSYLLCQCRDDANQRAAAAIFRHQNPKGADGLRWLVFELHND